MASSSSSSRPDESAAVFESLVVVDQIVNERPPPPGVVFTPLADLDVMGDFSIRVLICRSWEAKNPNGKYLGTEYVFSDDQGNAIHAITRNSIAHCIVIKLVVGDI